MIHDPASLFAGFFSLLPCCCFPLVGLLGLAGTAFWIWMLVDCATKMPDSKQGSNEKIAWILVLVFTHWLGGLIYYFVVKRPRDQSDWPM